MDSKQQQVIQVVRQDQVPSGYPLVDINLKFIWNQLNQNSRQTLIKQFIFKLLEEAVVVMQQLDLQLPVQSMLITTNIVSLNPAHGEVYSIQHFLCDKVFGGFLRILRFPPPIKLTHDITEILLKAALKTINQTKPTIIKFHQSLHKLFQYNIINLIYWIDYNLCIKLTLHHLMLTFFCHFVIQQPPPPYEDTTSKLKKWPLLRGINQLYSTISVHLKSGSKRVVALWRSLEGMTL